MSKTWSAIGYRHMQDLFDISLPRAAAKPVQAKDAFALAGSLALEGFEDAFYLAGNKEDEEEGGYRERVLGHFHGLLFSFSFTSVDAK